MKDRTACFKDRTACFKDRTVCCTDLLDAFFDVDMYAGTRISVQAWQNTGSG
ncbi:hypothetical protein [Streptomyces poonensis]|uniref:Uncharacterized protein n=1 Tax=Streptomyces poonensis TaxID=68255 RepID=A0A918PF28_9ACTN|nr:hypothetical protein [Streptomyces poonensis]GGZ04103.1 hypothetical protein GCM10010365_23770 [Streptomyces poonensis]GLJ90816.1 hypothetical protein GCM10017589_34210 [Streptomyces poonensis]